MQKENRHHFVTPVELSLRVGQTLRSGLSNPREGLLFVVSPKVIFGSKNFKEFQYFLKNNMGKNPEIFINREGVDPKNGRDAMDEAIDRDGFDDEIEEGERGEDEDVQGGDDSVSDGISRRKFLGGALLAIGAVAAGSLPSIVDQFAGDEKSGQSIDPEKNIHPKKQIQKGGTANPKKEKIEAVPRENNVVEKRENEKNLADLYLDAYKLLSPLESKFPDEIFEKDLLIAQQCQESRGEIDAESHSGALGVMQNMTTCLQDVTRYLNILKRKTGFDWRGPRDPLSEEQVQALKKLIVEKSDYSRAFGKIYLMQLWDNKYGYGVGRKAHANHNAKEAQIELMGAYNAGFGRVKGKGLDEWKRLKEKYRGDKSKKGQIKFRAYNEAIVYVERIFNYKARLNNIRSIIKDMNLVFDGNEDYAARQIALKMDDVKVGVGQDFRQNRYNLAKELLFQFKKINETIGRGPTDIEIDKIVVIEKRFDKK